MKSIKVSQDEMRRRMARFKDLKSYQYQNEEIERKHGRKTVDALDGIGIRFNAGVET